MNTTTACPKNTHNRRALWTAILLALIPACIATAADIATTVSMETRTVRFQNGVNGYDGALEVGISKEKPKTTATGKVLVVDGALKDEKPRQVLVRFDGIIGNGAGQVPSGAGITKAILRVYAANETSAHRIFFHRMLVPWKADAAWNYAAWGRDGVRMNGRDAVAEPDVNNVFFNKDHYYEVDVTPSLRAWAAGAPNHGWVLNNTRTQSNKYGFCSSRMTSPKQRPELIVTFDADPANKAPRIGALSASLAKSKTTTAAAAASLNIQATDTDNDSLNVVFYGRKEAEAAPDYSIILLPDTQYYTRERHGGTMPMMEAQVSWIIKNAKRHGIASVFHLGDISDQGDVDEVQWQRAAAALYKLEKAVSPAMPDGIPYCLAVGNHDQKFPRVGDKIGDGGPAELYNKYFGVPHFKGKSYYGGHYGKDNNNYYVLFDAGQEKGVVISLEYMRPRKDPDVLKWAAGVLKKHSDRRAFVITHYTMSPGLESRYSPDGKAIYEALKGFPNLVFIAGGHVTGEGRRADVHNGRTVYGIVQDFQFDGKGGQGFLGIVTLSPRQNRIHVKTYSPFINEWRTDPASEYSLDYDFGTKVENFTELNRMTVKSGKNTECVWDNLAPGSSYEWYAEVSDGKKTVKTGPRTFRVNAVAEKAGK